MAYKSLIQSKALYYRRVVFANPEMGTQQTYNLRVKYSAFFLTRVSILRYDKWLVVLSQSYTPSFTNFLRYKHNSSMGKADLNSSSKPTLGLHRSRQKHLHCIQTFAQFQKSPTYLF